MLAVLQRVCKARVIVDCGMKVQRINDGPVTIPLRVVATA